MPEPGFLETEMGRRAMPERLKTSGPQLMVQASTERIRLVGSAPGWDKATERDKALTAWTLRLTT